MVILRAPGAIIHQKSITAPPLGFDDVKKTRWYRFHGIAAGFVESALMYHNMVSNIYGTRYFYRNVMTDALPAAFVEP